MLGGTPETWEVVREIPVGALETVSAAIVTTGDASETLANVPEVVGNTSEVPGKTPDTLGGAPETVGKTSEVAGETSRVESTGGLGGLGGLGADFAGSAAPPDGRHNGVGGSRATWPAARQPEGPNCGSSAGNLERRSQSWVASGLWLVVSRSA